MTGKWRRLLSVFLIAAVAVTYVPLLGLDGMIYAASGSGSDNDTGTEISPIVQLELGVSTSAALLEDGSLWMWGCNANDQIGIYTDGKDVLTPYHVMDDVVRVETNRGGYTRALTKDGILWEWGGGKEQDARNPHFEAEPRKIIDNAVDFSGNLVLLGSGEAVEIERKINETSAPIKDEFKPSGITGLYYDGIANGSFEYSIKNTWNAGVADKLIQSSFDYSYGAISDDGNIYTWGRHYRGQLGLKPDFTWLEYQNYRDGTGSYSESLDPDVKEPTQVVCRNESDGALLDTPAFSKAIMTPYRTAFLASNGDLYFSGQYYSAKSWSSYIFSTPHYAASGIKDLLFAHDRILVKDEKDSILCYCGFDADLSEEEIDLFDTSGTTLTDNVETLFEDCDQFAINDSTYANKNFMLATKNDGSLWVRGCNDHGQLGLGDTENRDEWVSGFDVLRAIYGEDAYIPGDSDYEDEGYITESGRNKGQTWGQPLVWGRDTFRFTNTAAAFGQTSNTPHKFSSREDVHNAWENRNSLTNNHNYIIYTHFMGKEAVEKVSNDFASGGLKTFDYYQYLLDSLGSGFSEVDKRAMQNYIETYKWNGSCYGMSAVEAMNFRGDFDLSLADSSGKAKTLYELASPYYFTSMPIAQNIPLKDVIGFWQSVTDSQSVKTISKEFGDLNVKAQLTYLVTELQKNKKAPLMIGFAGATDPQYLNNDDPADDGRGVFSHAVLACALETENGPYVHGSDEYEYRVRIIDPNFLYNEDTNMEEANKYCMYINKACDKFYIPKYGFYPETEDDTYIKGECEIDYIGPSIPITKTLDRGRLKYSFLTSANNTCKVNGNVVGAATGTFAGLLDRYFAPSGTGSPVSFVMKEGFNPQVEVTQEGDTIGYQEPESAVYVKTGKGSTMQFEYQGVELHNKDGEYSVDITVNEGMSDLDNNNNVIVSGEGAADIDVQANDYAVVITSEDLDGVHVTVGDKEITLTDPEDPEQTAVEVALWGDELETSEHYFSLRTVDGEYSNLVYTGKNRYPQLTPIGYGEVKLQEGRDYEITWPKNSKTIGTHYAKLHFIGKYADEPDTKVMYLIVPGKAKISKLSSKNKAITVKYGKVKGAGGYQIAVRKGSGKWKKYNVKGYKKVTKTIKKLKKGKTYQVRVRAYKVVKERNSKGKTIKYTYYGAWSKARKVKVR